MKALDLQAVYGFIDEEIDAFYESRTSVINDLRLRDILRKNIYLFRAKNLLEPEMFIPAILDARLSASEERWFGSFFENLAIFISGQVCDGKKSSAKGIDLEFDDQGVRYLVAIKSGWNWGNSSQYQSLELNFKNALQVQRQAKNNLRVQAVLGMCYGNSRGVDTGLYLKKWGQSFWNFLSGDPELHQKILDRIGARASYHNRTFLEERTILESRLINEMRQSYCLPSGQLDWVKILRFNSGNIK